MNNSKTLENKSCYNVIGVMSGTSLDGIDLAHIHFKIENEKWSYQILESETVAYTDYWVQTLKNAIHFDAKKLHQLNIEYTQLLASVISSFIKKYHLVNIDAVCSHGHTILHQPQNKFTLQIGNLPLLGELLKHPIVCDFRIQDVLLGGQGAPLVPIGNRILFSEYDYCLNLGGFSNVSFEQNGRRLAFDISPVNTVLNFYANQLGFTYDDEGKIASTGKLNTDLLNQLNSLDFYQKSFPKSLGFEFVKDIILPVIEKTNLSTTDKMHTFIEHISQQIAKALPNPKGKMLITGGGTYNTFLISRMQHYLPHLILEIPEAKTIEFKEALIFGLLGVLRLRNEVNVLASVTGAPYDHCSGIVYN